MDPKLRFYIWLSVLLLLVVGFGLGGYLRNPQADVISQNNSPQAGAELRADSQLWVLLTLQTSWKERIRPPFSLDTNDSFQIVETTPVRFKTIGWGVFRWTAALRLQARQTGPSTTTHLVIPLSNHPDAPLRIAIPEYTISSVPPPTPTSSDTSEARPAKRSKARTLFSALGALVLFATIWYSSNKIKARNQRQQAR